MTRARLHCLMYFAAIGPLLFWAVAFNVAWVAALYGVALGAGIAVTARHWARKPERNADVCSLRLVRGMRSKKGRAV